MNIKNNIEIISQNLPAYTKLIVVSKTQPIKSILEAYNAGHRIFGENKVQELVEKYEALPKDIEWHMIGHLQSNKVKYIAPFVHLIHSVDSGKLLAEINKQAKKNNRQISCLLQIHIANEETKFGFSETEVLEFIKSEEFKAFNNIKIIGLMGMATLTDNTVQIKSECERLKKLFETIKAMPNLTNTNMIELSMGMSNDYQLAIENGSTLIRIGTAIFGERIIQ